jgi:ribonucleoside-diphosphate reductase alpha chain
MKMKCNGILIDLSRDDKFDKLGKQRLNESYMMPEEVSHQERFAYVCSKMGTDNTHSQRLYEYVSQHWLSMSTPILSYGKAKHGLPISCYLSYMEDTSNGLIDTLSEVNQLSMLGGGVGVGVGIRTSDNKSTGVMPHLNTYDACSLAYKQDGVRRGSTAMYLNIDHPDVLQFIEMRKATGDHNIRCLNLHHGLNVSDKFMTLIEKCIDEGQKGNEIDDTWNLIDPHSKEIRGSVGARDLWQRILETRMKTGEPYLCFIDTCNSGMYPFQREKGLSIKQSNLCTEIILPTDSTRTAVCCLSSLNLEYYDEWKDNDVFIHDVLEMLDNALSIFIERSPDRISRARNSAEKERSIGVGVLGFHALLQQKNIPFESDEAAKINCSIFKGIKEKIDKANLTLGALRGSPEDAEGTGRRFCCTMAIAPTATSSIIMGNTSPSIEPFRANAYRQDTLSGSFLNKNKYLVSILSERLSNSDEERVWSHIISNSGSVQQLPSNLLSDDEKKVFKTAFEIDQKWIIRHAADRQLWIDQSQSTNLFLKPDVGVQDLHSLHFNAWKRGLKSLYYLRSTKIVEADKISSNYILKQTDVSLRDSVCKLTGTRSSGCFACE